MNSMLKTKNLKKNFGALRVTDDVTLELKTGELHALIGPNGAGKTTLVNQISGELRSDSGSITFNDLDVSSLNINERARLGLVRSYQITSVFDEFTTLENVALSALTSQHHGFSFSRSLLSNTLTREVSEEALELVCLQHHRNTLAKQLSYGERRQLELAMALSMRPKFLLLDEPMAGMSVQESIEVVGLLQKLKRSYTILLIEHDMNAVFSLADRISVLVYGRLLVTGTPDEIKSNDEVRAIYLGDEEINPS